jgi:DNA-binding MarR family transcriptional regulator
VASVDRWGKFGKENSLKMQPKQENSALSAVDGERMFRLTLQLSTETLTAAAPKIEALGLEAKEFFVLDGLAVHPYPAELARHLSVPKPTITAYLKSLEARGLIARAIDPADLRRHRLELTEAGLETLTMARAALTDRYASRLVRLEKQEQRELLRILEKLCE